MHDFGSIFHVYCGKVKIAFNRKRKHPHFTFEPPSYDNNRIKKKKKP
jgi:hypothetical protein